MEQVTQADNAVTVKLTEWLIENDIFDEEGGIDHFKVMWAFGEVSDEAVAAHRVEATQAKDEEIARYRAALERIARWEIEEEDACGKVWVKLDEDDCAELARQALGSSNG